MITMASSLAYVLMLVLMVYVAIGQGKRRRCLQITDYDRLIEKQTTLKLTLEERIAMLEASNSEQSNLIQELNDTKKTIQETVVFSATETDKTNYQPGDIYVFTNTLVNLGSGYDSSTGYFEAPIAGTYIFSVQVCNKNATEGLFYIKVADEVILSTDHKGVNTAGNCASYTGIGIMQTGDKAWVECSWESSEYANDNWRWNVFSGVLL